MLKKNPKPKSVLSACPVRLTTGRLPKKEKHTFFAACPAELGRLPYPPRRIFFFLSRKGAKTCPPRRAQRNLTALLSLASCLLLLRRLAT